MKKIINILLIIIGLFMITQCASEIYTAKVKRNLVERYIEYLDSAFKAQVRTFEKSEQK